MIKTQKSYCIFFQIQELRKNGGLDALKDHPAVKRVTAQRMVIRHLHYVNDTDEDADIEMWDDILFVNISESDERLVMYNVNETNMRTVLDIGSDLDNEAEDGDEEEEDTGEIETEVDYDSYLLEVDSNRVEVKQQQKKNAPCSGTQCNREEDENGMWPASRPLRRSSLTLVGDRSYQF